MRLLNVLLGAWSAEQLGRATGLGLAAHGSAQAGVQAAAAALLRGGCPRGEVDPAAALVAMLTLGITDSNQALRRLGRVNFRLARARLPAVAEVACALNSRSNARQLSSLASEEGPDALALGETGSDLLLLCVEGVPIYYEPPEGCAGAAAAGAAGPVPAGDGRAAKAKGGAAAAPAQSRSSSRSANTAEAAAAPLAAAAAAATAAVAALPPPPDPAATLLDLASTMKGTMAGVMAAMQPQLQLLSQLDRRVREANLVAASTAADKGAQGALQMASACLARASSGSSAPLPGAVLLPQSQPAPAGEERRELAEAAASFRAWVSSVEAALGALKEKLDRV